MTKFIFFRVSRHYAKGALQYIIPILLQKLTKQEELDDEDDWNPSKAAGVCLMLLATCCEDEIVPHVLPFIKENIKSDNWRFRDASLMAFGSILGGLENNTLRPLVEQVSFNICNHVDHFFFYYYSRFVSIYSDFEIHVHIKFGLSSTAEKIYIFFNILF